MGSLMILGLASLWACVALTIRAQVTVPLTDSWIRLTGNGHYDETLCGGTIFLPDLGDAVSLTFVGPDGQFEFILNPHADPRNLTIQPDGIIVAQGSGNWVGSSPLPAVNCSDRTVVRVSEMIKGQLFFGNHTVTVTNAGRPENQGTGIIVSRAQYYRDPIPGLPTVSFEPGPHGSSGSNKAIIGGAVGGTIGFFLLLVPAIVMFYRRRRSRAAELAGPREARLDMLSPGDTTAAFQGEGGLAMTPAEKSEIVDPTPRETPVNVVHSDIQGGLTPANLLQDTQPQSPGGSKPLPVPPVAQSAAPDISTAIISPQPAVPQLSAQQLRLVQELMDQGLSSAQVAGVVQSMLASSGSRDANAGLPPAAVAEYPTGAPPEYDFKDNLSRNGS